MTPHPQIIALRDIVRQHNPRPATEAREYGKQHVALQGLGFIDDDEAVMQRTPSDMGYGEYFQQSAAVDFFHDIVGTHAFENVVDGLCLRADLLGFAAWALAYGLA